MSNNMCTRRLTIDAGQMNELRVIELDVAHRMQNLAGLYEELGKYDNAMPLYQRSLAITEKVHVEKHPDVATSRIRLARLYYKMGKYADALSLHQRGLATAEDVLGEEHSDEVATAWRNVALFCDSMGKADDAAPLLQRSFSEVKNEHRKEHSDVATNSNSLATSAVAKPRRVGKYADALPIYQRTDERSLATDEKALLHCTVYEKAHPEEPTTLHCRMGRAKHRSASTAAELGLGGKGEVANGEASRDQSASPMTHPSA
eukprot:1144585-Prorocentrum_minimum.AAC.4